MRPVVTLMAVLALGCSADSGGGSPFGPSSSVDGGTGGPPPAADAGGSWVRDAVPIRDTGSGVIAPDAACATTTSDAQRAPIDLLLLIDRSGSMAMGGPPSKWASAVAGIHALLDRLTDDTRVGLTLFPALTGATDSADTYVHPDVPVGPLATTRAAINALLARTSPNGGTPMACAAQGTMRYYGPTFPLDGSRNVVLITDGDPTEECAGGPMCALFPPDLACLLAAIARAPTAVLVAVAMGFHATPPVRTFATGTPEASDQYLSDVAVNGGTRRSPTCMATSTCHYSLRLGTFAADLDAALDDIRGRALSCEFQVNVDPRMVDPTRVNVNYSGTGVPRPTLVPRDVAHHDGWDYGAGMRTVVLYGATCDRVRTDPAAHVQILFGCPTVTPG